MYPLVLIFALALLKNTKDSAVYGLALSLVGLGTSLYHNLLYYKIIPDSITPCSEGVSCTSKQIEWLMPRRAHAAGTVSARASG